MRLRPTPLAGVTLVELALQVDARGQFTRLFCAREMAELAGGEIAQINRSLTRRPGTVRGLHYQGPPALEAKTIFCLAGAVWDVAVDLRRGSPTFLQWHAVVLTRANQRALHLPPGVAHGFQTLEPDSELLYLHSQFYAPEHEGGVRPDDPRLGITWPREIAGLSERDQSFPLLSDDFPGVEVA
ncbi:MAG: dTDP-4-dehydrorhamnose 3,5-epimerase family protein [Deltaproteobacteria bacterium]|nr:dTDP-4-dehydrorhamnose 3,5-epimerase family protein [Deltaproteobacteria bacterium]